MVCLVNLLILTVASLASAKPFLYDAPKTIASLVGAASSSSHDNISVLTKRQDVGDIDISNDASPSIFQQKIDKVLAKIRFLSRLAAPTKSEKDDDFQKELDEFDREFDEDSKGALRVEYGAPLVEKKVKLEEAPMNGLRFNGGDVGVFLMELIGSFVGLVYGAAAQLNQGGATTASPDV